MLVWVSSSFLCLHSHKYFTDLKDFPVQDYGPLYVTQFGLVDGYQQQYVGTLVTYGRV
jgi:hypothetical protein